MTVDKILCKGLKETGRWIPEVCELCRNRKHCKEKNTEKKKNAIHQ